MAEVITMPTSLAQLAERIRAAISRTECSRAEWIEGTIILASALYEARQHFPADQHFSHWLVDNDLDAIGAHDRAALINMGCFIDQARVVLQDTRRSSWQMIWREELAPRIDSITKPDLPAVGVVVPGRRRRHTKADASRFPPPLSDVEASTRLVTALDGLVRGLDGLDLAAAQRGLASVTQRKHLAALVRSIRNWLDILEISK